MSVHISPQGPGYCAIMLAQKYSSCVHEAFWTESERDLTLLRTLPNSGLPSLATVLA